MKNQASPQKIMDALKALAKISKGNSLNELRLVLALERAIARLDQHPKLSKHLVFKGGFVLLKTINTSRFTRDVDALAIGLSRKKVPEHIVEALETDLHDGLWFGDVITEDLKDQGPYGGYRFTVAFQIGAPASRTAAKIKRLSRIHIDVGFGDAVESVPKKQTMPSILKSEAPVTWSVYPFEYIFAEKLEALFSRGSSNSRAKDIYDMPLIFKRCKNLKNLSQAINKTFENRKTPIPDSFAQTAEGYELLVLKNSWPSVELMDEGATFESSWQALLRILRSLDA
jgi:predicted nucleotidyltransferase component of viral defense system